MCPQEAATLPASGSVLKDTAALSVDYAQEDSAKEHPVDSVPKNLRAQKR